MQNVKIDYRYTDYEMKILKSIERSKAISALVYLNLFEHLEVSA